MLSHTDIQATLYRISRINKNLVRYTTSDEEQANISAPNTDIILSLAAEKVKKKCGFCAAFFGLVFGINKSTETV